MPVGRPGVYYVTAQRGERNPNGYVVQVREDRAFDLVGGMVGGTPETLKLTHRGLHDIVLAFGMGAGRAGIEYLQFQGARYRAVDNHNFSECRGLPNYDDDDKRWCFDDVRAVEGK